VVVRASMLVMMPGRWMRGVVKSRTDRSLAKLRELLSGDQPALFG
jgi:hypothetical protein